VPVEEFRIPESSNIAGASYDTATHVLTVQFKGRGKDGAGGASYRYADIPEGHWRGFQDSKTKGGYFASRIKPHYKGVEL
jgi:KTSC domain